MKQIAIDVKEFAVPSPRKGSIEQGSGYGSFGIAALGVEVHKSIQQKRREVHHNYRWEIKISHKFLLGEYCIAVNGRIDGIFQSDGHFNVASTNEGGAFGLNESCENPTTSQSARSMVSRSSDADISTRGYRDSHAKFGADTSSSSLDNAAPIETASTQQQLPLSQGAFVCSSIGRGATHIEEIKSAYLPAQLSAKLRSDPFHPYCLQVRTYAYAYWKQHGEMPTISIHVVSLGGDNAVDVPVEMDLPSYELWLECRLKELVDFAEQQESDYKRRKRTSAKLELPFERARPGQKELIEQLESGIGAGKTMVVQAPTGLGKTIAVMLPALRDSLKRGQRLVYVTPKNSIHLVAEEAIEQLRKKKVRLKSLTLSSRAKLCLMEEQVCDATVCEYARDYHSKVDMFDLVNLASKNQRMTPNLFSKLGEKYKVCPFELAVDCIDRADVVICDYNHVFAPISLAGRLTSSVHKRAEKTNLVIDEAHNLHTRATDYFSATVSTSELSDLYELLRPLQSAGAKLALRCKELVTRSIHDGPVMPTKVFGPSSEASTVNGRSEKMSRRDERIEVAERVVPAAARFRGRGPNASGKICLNSDRFVALNDSINELVQTTLQNGEDLEKIQPVIELSRLWSGLCSALQYTDSEQIHTYKCVGDDVTIKVTCCDANKWLRKQYAQFENVVAFSATLKPFDYYCALTGFDTESSLQFEAASPFPVERRKVMVIPQISTKYADRASNYQKICDVIERVTAVRRANYIVFFPSFDFLEQVFTRLPSTDYKLLKQERGMTREQVSSVLTRMKGEQSFLLFAVQGGVFSEGVDFPGDMASGAIIVGPGLPSFELERELLREYYDRTYGSGFDYAYAYPAMTKVIQSAGRVVRSEDDRGLIVLLDRRFLQKSYVQAMPSDWYSRSADELVSTSILKDVRTFWQQDSASDIGGAH